MDSHPPSPTLFATGPSQPIPTRVIRTPPREYLRHPTNQPVWVEVVVPKTRFASQDEVRDSTLCELGLTVYR